MKNKSLALFLFFALTICIVSTMTSCKTKEGCGLQEKYGNADLESSKRGESNLFSKKQQKRMKKHR